MADNAEGKNQNEMETLNELIGPIVQQQIIVWSEDGLPMPATRPLLQKEKLNDLALAAMSLPFKAESDKDREFEGMTNAEVMMIRLARNAAHGDRAAIESLLDRVNGKPTQTSKVATVSMTYEELLKANLSKVVDAEVIDDSSEKADDDKDV